jgi:feruloyl esterase
MGSESKRAAYTSPDYEPNGLGIGWAQNWLGCDPNWNYTKFNYSLVELTNQLTMRNKLGRVDVTDFDFSPFHARGGKLFSYHGMTDGLIPTGHSTYLYEQVLKAVKQKGVKMDDFYRIFLVPGLE